MELKLRTDMHLNRAIEVRDIREIKYKIQEIKNSALNNENIALLQKLDNELSDKLEKIIKNNFLEEK
ncbi:MAG: hypothetical protein N4A62_14675 [Marinisporobacter sp.]|jgi:predicted RNA-binding protein with EMAP domain|nr:hypothetical protein [Marinisporobacter sp.]